MDAFLGRVAGLLVNMCLQYPVTGSAMAMLGVFTFVPIFTDTRTTHSLHFLFICMVGFGILVIILVNIIPVLQLTPDRILFRPAPSGSIFERPSRYICFTLDPKTRKQIFYVTTKRKCDNDDPNMNKATNFYIISPWIPSFNHYLTKRSVQFQPITEPGEIKPSYSLPEGYCVRAAGPVSNDPLRVAFTSIDAQQEHIHDTGYISKEDLIQQHSGWYFVSNCRTDIGRWLFNCETGYISSVYVSLPEYTRILLIEKREQHVD